MKPSTRAPFLSSDKKDDELNQHKLDKHWLKMNEVYWTLLDEKRMTSLDSLHRRTKEYHRNIHTIKNQDDDFGKSFSDFEREIRETHDNSNVAFSFGIWSLKSITKLHNVLESDIPSQLPLIEVPSTGVLWIHLDKLAYIGHIIQKFGLHELVSQFFYDLRAHSSMIELPIGLLLSLCAVHIQDESCLMHKLYIFTSRGICITFEAELVPDLTRVVNPTKDSMRETTTQRLTQSRLTTLSRFKSMSGRFNSVSLVYSKSGDVLFPRIQLMIPLVAKKMISVGSGYLLFQLVMEMLTVQDPLLEFTSRAIFHYKR